MDVGGVDATGVHEADSGADTEVDKDREVSGVRCDRVTTRCVVVLLEGEDCYFSEIVYTLEFDIIAFSLSEKPLETLNSRRSCQEGGGEVRR